MALIASALIQNKDLFQQHVQPLVQNKLGISLSNCSNLQECFALLKDLFQMWQDLKNGHINQSLVRVANLVLQHKKLLSQIVGLVAEQIVQRLNDVNFRQFLIEKLQFVIQSLSMSSRFGLVSASVQQCRDLCQISNNMTSVMSQIPDEEVNDQFATIRNKITKLKEKVEEVNNLMVLYEQMEDDFESEQLFELINNNLNSAIGNEYCEAIDAIDNLRRNIEEHEEKLQQARNQVVTGGVVSGLGLLSVTALRLLPVVGPIVTVASIAGSTVATIQNQKIKRSISEVKVNLEKLFNHERELERTMQQIIQQQELMNELKVFDLDLK